MSIWTLPKRDRQDLDWQPQTLTIFKNIFPTFQDWENSLTKYSVDKAWIHEEDYVFLLVYIGNSYLRYSLREKMIPYIALQFKNLYGKRMKKQRIYDLKYEDILQLKNESVNTLYNLGGTTDTNDYLKPEYVSGASKNTNTQTLTLVNNLNIISLFNNMKLPQLQFIEGLAIKICHPYQPSTYTGEIL